MQNILRNLINVDNIFSLCAIAIWIIFFAYRKKGFKNSVPLQFNIIVFLLPLVPVLQLSINAYYSYSNLYRIRVTVMNVNGAVEEEPVIRSSSGGDISNYSGGALIQLHASQIPKNKKITIYAAKDEDSSFGSKELILGDELNVNVEINLKQNVIDKLSGIVEEDIDEGKVIQISGVNVLCEGKSYLTNQCGQYEILGSFIVGRQYSISFQKKGYDGQLYEDTAGKEIERIRLKRQSK